MNSFLLNRQLGSVSPQAFAKAQHNRLLKSLQSAKDVRLALGQPDENTRNGIIQTKDLAHAAGVSSIAIDRFEGR